MARALWEKLRGARRAWVLAALALLALIALLLPRSAEAPPTDGTALEARLERILSLINPEGDVKAMITENGEGNVTGAVIVAEGLDDVSTYLELESAAMTLLQIDASQVEIIGNLSKGG